MRERNSNTTTPFLLKSRVEYGFSPQRRHIHARLVFFLLKNDLGEVKKKRREKTSLSPTSDKVFGTPDNLTLTQTHKRTNTHERNLTTHEER